MDVWALNLKGGGLVWGPIKKHRKSEILVLRQTPSWRATVGDDGGGGFEIRIPATSRRSSSLVVRAAGKKRKDDNSPPSGDNNPSIPDGDGSEGINPDHDKSKLDDFTHRSRNSLLDWRDFRANLVARGQVPLLDSDSHTLDPASRDPSHQLGSKWAHPIPMAETGCVLVATEKLDGVRSFERSVVLLLRLGTRDPREGPFGVIINRPLHKKIKHMKPSNPDLANTFSDCTLHSGGPLDASMFLLKTKDASSIPGFEQVVPGLCFGARNNLDEAAALVKKGLVKPQDFRFFVGYAGWQLDQLRQEIASRYWVVAACSTYLVSGASADSSSGLWEEILQLMGGPYSELSRKPKQDDY